MKKKILWLGLSFLLVAALALASCGPAEEEGEQEEEEEEEEEEVRGESEKPGDMSPSWSPDRDKIVFYSNRDGN